MLLEANNLTVSYGVVKALEGVSFHVGTNEIVTMIGPNGAGKSTALKAVSGLLGEYGGKLLSGEVFFDGEPITNLRTDQLVRGGIAIVPEGRRVFPSMTVQENLEMGSYTRRNDFDSDADLRAVLELFPRLKENARKRAGALSTGEQQMLAFGRALMLRPRLLMADEPSLGLSPEFVELIFDKIREINRLGASILLVEQNAGMALEVSHRAYVFGIGRITMSGSTEVIRLDPRLRQVYFGGIDQITG